VVGNHFCYALRMCKNACNTFGYYPINSQRVSVGNVSGDQAKTINHEDDLAKERNIPPCPTETLTIEQIEMMKLMKI